MAINLDLALRYIHAENMKHTNMQDYQKAKALAEKAPAYANPKYIWKVFPPVFGVEGIYLQGADLLLSGNAAKKMLTGCHSVIVLAITLGQSYEQWLMRLSKTDMSAYVIADALGSVYIDELTDELEKEMKKHFPNDYFTDRFSCGYADLPLELQPKICSILQTPTRIGAVCTPSLLMNPQKTITAFIGISKTEQPARIRGCEYCNFSKNCVIKQKGQRCYEY
jgi:hypothetical protein